MRRMKLALVFVFLLAASGCPSTRSGVKFEPLPDAPVLEPRPEGCHVDIHERGKPVTRPHKVVGTLVLEASRDQVQAEGGAGVTERMKTAACTYGIFIVKDIKAYPNAGVQGGVVYEAEAAVLLDENGNIPRPTSPKETAASAEEAPEAAGGQATTEEGG